MKLILSLMLVCLVTISQQENLARAHYRARAHYLPLFYSNGLPAGYDLINDDKVILNEFFLLSNVTNSN